MSGRSIVHAIAAVGWLVAGVFAYAFISLFGFFGVGFYGLLLLFICMQVGLDGDESASRSTAPTQAMQSMSGAERALYGLQRSLTTTGFFTGVGIALTAIGFGGFLYFQLD